MMMVMVMLSIESYGYSVSDQWTILTSIPGALSKTWPQSLGIVSRRIYISVFHTSNSFIVMQEGYYFRFGYSAVAQELLSSTNVLDIVRQLHYNFRKNFFSVSLRIINCR